MNGNWITLSEKQPPKYGKYKVMRRGRGRTTYEDELLWNGASFVTHKNCLTNAVEKWWEESE